MSHLKIVRDEPTKAPTKRPARRPYSSDLIVGDDQTRAKQALRNLHDAFGTWGALSAAMHVTVKTIHLALRHNRVTPAMMYAASKASGLSIVDPLPLRHTAAGRCWQYEAAVRDWLDRQTIPYMVHRALMATRSSGAPRRRKAPEREKDPQP